MCGPSACTQLVMGRLFPIPDIAGNLAAIRANRIVFDFGHVPKENKGETSLS
jgi:hypothetical protein